MNNLIAGAAVRALIMIGSSFVVGKGWATANEVSGLTDQISTVGAGLVALGTAAYSIYTRTTSKQVKMTNSIPAVTIPAVAKKK